MQFKALSEQEQKMIDRACEILEAGGLVAFPTETVYGLGANADDREAVAKVFAAKRRPTWHPLIVHLPDAESIGWWAKTVPEDALKLASRFWPGPLTLLLPKAERCGDWVTGGQPNVGLRCPSSPLGHALFKAFSGPTHRGIVGPSANSFGRISPTTAKHIEEDLGVKPEGKVDFILDGGPCTIGVESTIVNLSGPEPELMRYGAITREMLEEVLGRPVRNPSSASPKVSGQLKSHYAPATPVSLLPEEEIPGAIAAMDPVPCAVLAPAEVLALCPANAAFRLEASKDAARYTAEIYSNLHKLDAAGCERIFVAQPPKGSRWAAVNDRLSRAAAPKTALLTPGAA